jgi:FkbM family methyltransferase
VKSLFRRKLSRLWKPVRQLRDRLRGLEKTPITHEDIARLIDRPDPTILEIGCNDGSDTLKFLEIMPRAKLFCFEPDPRAIARFKTTLGPKFAAVKLFEIALSDRTGQIDFHMSDGKTAEYPQGYDQSGSIRRPAKVTKYHPWLKFEKTVKVTTCRLDDWATEHNVSNVDFIWMDVQGAEGDVIIGAPHVLQATRFLYTEYNNHELYDGQLSLKALLALLPSFELITRYPNDVLLRNRSIRGN